MTAVLERTPPARPSNHRLSPAPAHAWLPAPGEVGTRRLTMTPEQAEAFLSRNVANRPLSEGNILSIEAELLAGRAIYDATPIRFDVNGELIDGQHRCHAVVRSGVPLDVLVVYGLPVAAKDVIDTGRVRKGSDSLAMAGEVNTSILASTLRLVARWSDEAGLQGGRDRRVSNAELMGILARTPGIREAVAVVSGSREHRTIAPPSVMAFTIWLLRRIDHGAADYFINSTVEGANLGARDPRLILRRVLLNAPARRTIGDYRNTLAWFIKAWNAHRSGSQISLLAFKPSEAFPLPRGLAPSVAAA